MRAFPYLPRTLCIVAFLLCGCHERHNGPPVIAIIPKTTATNVWKAMHSAVLQQSRVCNCKIEWNAPESEADYPQQASMVEDAIARHVSGIILAPSHQLVLASSVRRANQLGIPVVIVDSPIALSANQYAAFIGPSDDEIGFMAADRIGKLLNGHGTVGIIGVSPTIEESSTREDAFTQELNMRFPEIHIVDVAYGLSDWARSSQAAEDILAQHPDLTAIFASDGFATSGAASVLHHHHDRHVLLVGVGQEGDIFDGVRDHVIDSVIVEDSYAMGTLAMKTMTAVLAHQPVRPYTSIPVQLVTSANVDSVQKQQQRTLQRLSAGVP